MIRGKRYWYHKEYREKYGDLMKEQIKEWFKKHPNYHKNWRKRHSDYWHKWRKRHLKYRREYERMYYCYRKCNKK